jgi:membrane-bound serine protease (ClpP class)
MLFLEINSPGFGIPGVVAIVAFLCVFGANALLGSVGSLEMILFLFGIGLLAVEIFVLPGFGVAGISGLILIGLSLVFTMQDFVMPSLPWEWELLGRNLVVVSLGVIAAIFGIAVIILLGPRLRIFDRLTLKTRIEGTAGGPDRLPADADYESDGPAGLVGKRGKALTTLRPSGKAEIKGRSYVVESDASFVEQGTEVQVVRVRGNRIVVRSLT